ncbi:MAG: hypothetical protein O7H41_01320 [Planctomycetota bacterium]|nr:hypothetical protein [Planctomycetota bacterium]
MRPGGGWATFLFEARRTLTFFRVAWWFALTLFPVALVLLMSYLESLQDPKGTLTTTFAPLVMILFMLIPNVTCMLAALLWATTIVQAELESRTWLFVSVRPHGRTSIFLGKFAIAFIWTASTGLVSLGLILALLRPERGLEILGVMGGIVVLSALVYGALFGFIGVLTVRRGMVVAVIYALLFEFLFSLIPVLINRITLSYRIRSLTAQLFDDAKLTELIRAPVGPEGWWFHLLVALAVAAGLLVASIYMLRSKELATHEG